MGLAKSNKAKYDPPYSSLPSHFAPIKVWVTIQFNAGQSNTIKKAKCFNTLQWNPSKKVHQLLFLHPDPIAILLEIHSNTKKIQGNHKRKARACLPWKQGGRCGGSLWKTFIKMFDPSWMRAYPLGRAGRGSMTERQAKVFSKREISSEHPLLLAHPLILHAQMHYRTDLSNGWHRLCPLYPTPLLLRHISHFWQDLSQHVCDFLGLLCKWCSCGTQIGSWQVWSAAD